MADKQFSSQKIMMITIVVAILLILIIWPLSIMGKGDTSTGSSDDAELRIQPVARVEMQKAVVKSDGKPRDGATVYNAVCIACHAAGVAGAPKTGDKAAWAPRIAAGNAALLMSATNGKNAMPPRGGAADLTDSELKAAVEYLVGQAK
jgi:cytochrome c5